MDGTDRDAHRSLKTNGLRTEPGLSKELCPVYILNTSQSKVLLFAEKSQLGALQLDGATQAPRLRDCYHLRPPT